MFSLSDRADRGVIKALTDTEVGRVSTLRFRISLVLGQSTDQPTDNIALPTHPAGAPGRDHLGGKEALPVTSKTPRHILRARYKSPPDCEKPAIYRRLVCTKSIRPS